MKKLISIFLVCLFLGCGYSPIDIPNSYLHITSKSPYTGGFICYYKGEGNSGACLMCVDDFLFIDSCHKFSIGDNIKITK